jgi:hypothetical protein
MSHTLATVDQFKKHLTDNAAGIDSGSDSDILSTLAGASRAVEAFCDRSDWDTGFGPRVASNRYEGDGTDALWLRDDLLGASITVYSPPTEGTATYTLAESTDFYLEPFSGPPYRIARLHGYGALGAFPSGSRIVVAGTASSAPISLVTTSVTMGTVGSSATTINVSAGSVVSAGHTIRYGTEDIYVTAVSSGTALTVQRGQNGTTAAAIADASTVVLYQYPTEAVEACLAVAQRRRKSRDAGLTGNFGINPTSGFQDTERSVLRANIHSLKVYGA